MLLQVEDLTVRYGAALPAIEGIHLHIAAGESLGLIGESGSGKSTLGRSFLRLFPESVQIEGSIAFEEEQLLTLPETELQAWRGRKIAQIFQDPMTRLNPLMTIAEHGLEVLRSHSPRRSRRQARQKLAEVLQAVRIDPSRANQYPHEFSGGMRQRVAIALAILLDPALLIADEPTTSLDVTTANEILLELTTLRRDRGMALLLISHDLGLVGRYCDRIAVMLDGVIVEVGETAQVLNQPQHPYTRSLLESVVRFEGTLSAPTPTVTEDRDRPLLRVQDLTKHYTKGSFLQRMLNPDAGVIRAIDGVSLEIYPGDIFGIIGESGSGKSSTARAILQLISPDSGSVEFDGIELTKLKGKQLRHMRSQMQMVFQDPRAAFSPHLRVLESVIDPLRIHNLEPNPKAAQQRALAILERVGLSPAQALRFPKELSGGQLQRAAIARALILQPRFLICDEPVSMLDATIQKQILDLMKDLHQEFGLTYLFITHDLAIAKFFCTQVAVMYRGEIVERGTAREVLTNPQHAYTQSLIASVAGEPI